MIIGVDVFIYSIFYERHLYNFLLARRICFEHLFELVKLIGD